MSKRLVEVATELNVSTKDITDFLTEKGFEVGSSRNAKIQDEAFQLVVSKFKKSLDVKEKAEKLSIGATTRKKEEKPKGNLRTWEKPSMSEKEPKSLKKLRSQSSQPPQQEEPAPATPPAQEQEKKPKVEVIKAETPEVKGPKILGKVDLSTLEGTRKSRSSKGVKAKHTNRKKEDSDKGKEQKTPKEEQAPKLSDVPSLQEKTVVLDEPKKDLAPKQEQPLPKVEAKEQPKQELKEAAQEEKPKITKQEPSAEQKTPAKQEEGSNSDSDKDDVARIEAPTLRGLKILGKINIETTPSGKKKKRKRERKPETTAGPGQAVQGRRGTRRKTKTEGYTNERRREEDIKKGDTPSEEKPKLDISYRKKGTPSTTGTGTGTGSTTDSTGRNKRKKKKGVSTREVDENVRATMARLHGGGKKRNRRTTRSARDERKERLRQEDSQVEELTLQVTEFITVSELASLMDISATEVITTCMQLGVIVSINQRLDAEIIELVASEFDYDVEFISAEDQMDIEEDDEEDAEEDLQTRAPIVTVMGHVDHGKTSLLDYIRKANVTAGEAGGITQHIGAYEVSVPHMNDKRVTFLDTPGHEAFTAMRARGAKVTDIAVIIIAADDNVMPQTKEAISHAQAANVPMVFAINKVDKDGAMPDRIRQELAAMNLLVEEWGGKYQSQEVSAKFGENVDQLLEKIVLEAELLDLKANPDRNALGTILEASLEKGRGYVAKVLVQKGTLNIGDVIVSGAHSGKVKAMFNERGKRVKTAGPSSPVLVLGLDGAPQAGEKLKVLDSERDARDLANRRAQILRQQQIRATKRITLDEIGRRLALGSFKNLNLIVKGDMDGSVEALSDSLIKLSTEEVQTDIVYKAVGPITESDVLLASASDAIIIGFQVRPNPMAKKLAEQEGVQIKLYSVIYSAVEEVKSALEGMLEPKKVEKELGQILIQEVYKINKVGTVAGCIVQEGKVNRNNFIRIVRDGIVVYPNKEGVNGELGSLRRFKENVMDVKNGMECGLTIKNFTDIKEGDIVEVYDVVEVKQTL